jgi:hypothetical protein
MLRNASIGTQEGKYINEGLARQVWRSDVVRLTRVFGEVFAKPISNFTLLPPPADLYDELFYPTYITILVEKPCPFFARAIVYTLPSPPGAESMELLSVIVKHHLNVEGRCCDNPV